MILKMLAVFVIATFVILGISVTILELWNKEPWFRNMPKRKRLTREELKHLKRINDGKL